MTGGFDSRQRTPAGAIGDSAWDVREICIADRRLTLELADAQVAAAVGPAFGALVQTRPPLPDGARLRIWAGSDSGHPLWRGELPGAARLPGGGIAVSRACPAALEAFLPDRELILWGTREAFAGGDIRAHPASTALAAWLARGGAQMLHVAAVANPSGAVLLVGASGAGKSTAALACAARGFGVLGDDLCVVTFDERPRVHAVYATAKLNPDAAARLGLETLPVLGANARGKRVMSLDGLRVPRSAEIVALVVLAGPAGAVGGPEPLSPAEAARALLPTALKAALGAGGLAPWLRLSAQLARSLPGFRVTVGWDLDALTDAIARAAELGRAGGSR